MKSKEYTDYLNLSCQLDEHTKRKVELLDQYDFSAFLGEGRSLYNLYDAIEQKYDKEFERLYGTYVFNDLDIDDIIAYFGSRYNVWFQEYTDWVVRHDNGPYSKAEKRIANSC